MMRAGLLRAAAHHKGRRAGHLHPPDQGAHENAGFETGGGFHVLIEQIRQPFDGGSASVQLLAAMRDDQDACDSC